jgi:flagellar FliL protein
VDVEEDTNDLGPLFNLDTMIVNLAGNGGKRYLRVTMALGNRRPGSRDGH